MRLTQYSHDSDGLGRDHYRGPAGGPTAIVCPRAIFPNPEALLRSPASFLSKLMTNGKTASRYLSEGSMALLATPAANPKEVATSALLTAWSALPADLHG